MNALTNIEPVTADVTIEQELLGALIVSDQALPAIERDLSASDFSDARHSQIFEMIISVKHDRGSITPALIIAALGGDKNAIVSGEVTLGQYVARLAASACIPAHLKAYAKQIREFSDRRKILAAAETMMLCIQANQPAADIAGGAIGALDEIATAASAGATPQVSIREADDEAL